MHLYELNGFYYLKDCDKYYDWLSDTDNVPYFMLNNTTRTKFIQDILPLIKSGTCTYQQIALDNIRNFTQVPKRTLLTRPQIVEPDPDNKPLMPHQLHAVSLMLEYPKYAFFLGTGTGKTLIAISLLMTMQFKRALIVTPKKVIDQYKEEVDKYIPNNNHLIINYEQVSKYLDEDFDVVILDESHKAKNKSSDINRFLKKITSRVENVYLFTGTPQDKNRHDLFAQFYLLYTHFMPGKTKFLNRYFNQNDYYQPESEKQAFSDELTEMIQSISWGQETDNVLDLTNCPEVDHIVDCGAPDGLYEKLMKQRFFEFPDGSVVVADSKAKLKLKLREICSGFVRVEKQTEEGIRKGTRNLSIPKLQPLIQLLQTLPNGIIYTEFKRDILYCTQACQAIGATYEVVDGSTKNSGALINRFKQGSIQFLVMQNKSGSAGLDLTCTNNVIFYTLPEGYIPYKQCKGRIRRPGQTKECNYYYLMCDSLEKDILKSLKRKKNFTTKIFKIYK